MAVQVDTLNLPALWQRGVTGKGVGIAVLDTGISAHPDVADRVELFRDFVRNSDEPFDAVGHGTSVAVAAAGDGTASAGWIRGAAPGAHIVAARVVDDHNTIHPDTLVAAIDWAIENRQQYNIRVLNMSFGIDDAAPAGRARVFAAIDRAVAAGIIPVVAAGNSGPNPQTVGSLASYPHVITVAAFDPHDTVAADDDSVWDGSSRGPGRNGEAKPDVCAPGADVWIGTLDAAQGGTPYVKTSGTSFATPVVAGVIADWLEAEPSLTFDDVKALIARSSAPLPGVAASAQGAGELRPLVGFEQLLQRSHGTQPAGLERSHGTQPAGLERSRGTQPAAPQRSADATGREQGPQRSADATGREQAPQRSAGATGREPVPQRHA